MHLSFQFQRSTPPTALPPPSKVGRAAARAYATYRRLTGKPSGPAIWSELHLRALAHNGSDDSAWLADFERRIIGHCMCRKQWREDLAQNAPDFGDYFRWTVTMHNAVNRRLGKPELTVDAARAIWTAAAETSLSETKQL